MDMSIAIVARIICFIKFRIIRCKYAIFLNIIQYFTFVSYQQTINTECLIKTDTLKKSNSLYHSHYLTMSVFVKKDVPIVLFRTNKSR